MKILGILPEKLHIPNQKLSSALSIIMIAPVIFSEIMVCLPTMIINIGKPEKK